MILGRVFRRMYEKKLAAQGLGRMPAKRVEDKFLAHVDNLETLLGKQRWLAGDARTIADIAVQAQLAEIARTSHLSGAIAQRSAVTEWLRRT
jgi:glutathione S-transferase